MLKKLSSKGIIVGIDEAGRGALAGPVVAGAVFIQRYVPFTKEFRDSKKIKASKREELYTKIIESSYIHHGIGIATVDEIDELNILQATFLAMHRAIKALNEHPDKLYVDGNKFEPYEKVPHVCVIGGDDKYISIAAASIMAKVHRDTMMGKYSKRYPAYGLDQNKGYGTSNHRNAIDLHGQSDIHRKSFKLKS